MQLSLSELKDLIYNAGLGAELTVGACEDFSFSVAVLESLSLNAASEFLYAIECDREPTQEFIITDNKVEITSGRALFEGIYAIDLFMAEKIDKIVFNIFDCPMLLIGLGYNYDNSNFVLLSSSKLIGSINSGEIFWDNNFVTRNCNVTLLRSQVKANSNYKQKDRVNLKHSVIKELKHLSSKMLVPESKESREKGAGAGTIDND